MVNAGERLQTPNQTGCLNTVLGHGHPEITGVFLASHQLVGIVDRLKPLGLQVHHIEVKLDPGEWIQAAEGQKNGN